MKGCTERVIGVRLLSGGGDEWVTEVKEFGRVIRWCGEWMKESGLVV